MLAGRSRSSCDSTRWWLVEATAGESVGVGAETTVAGWKVHRDAAGRTHGKSTDADDRDRPARGMGVGEQGGKCSQCIAGENAESARCLCGGRYSGHGVHARHEHLARGISVSTAVPGPAEARAQAVRTVEYAW